jgi:hypothetical protein
VTRIRLAHLPDEELTPRQLQHRRRAERDKRSADMPRATTISMDRFPKQELERLRALYPEDISAERPVTRADCVDGVRPCPFVGCHWNLYLDVNPKTGSIQLNFPHLEPDEMTASCVLDLASRGGMTMDEVGACTNITRERVRQIEVKATAKIANSDEAVALAMGVIGR